MKPLTLLAAVATTTALSAHLSSSNGVASTAQGPTGTARIVVKVVLSGPAPPAVKVQTSADPYCAKVHQADPLLSQTVQVGTDGALIDSLVFV